MDIHPIANKFPMLTGTELQQLADDIRENGLHHPIEIWRDMIVDGRNRFRACEIAGVEPRFKEGKYASNHEVTSFIISMNIMRRHLNPGQRAMLGEELRPGLRKEAEESLRAGQQKGADATKRRWRKEGSSTNSYESPPKPERKQPANVNAQIGLAVGVGAGTVADAQYVKKHTPELADKVISGEMTLGAAKKKASGESGSKKKKAQPPPPIDTSTLPMSAKEKLEAAIRQEKRRLQAEFDKAVQDELARALDETVLPTFNKEKAEFRQVIENRKGFMNRRTYRLILSCLHPDRVTDPEQKERYTKAFHAFSELELVLCNEKEMPTTSMPIPRTYEEHIKRREQMKAQRRRQTNSVANR